MATLESDVVATTSDGCTLTMVFDTSKYDAALDAYEVVSVSASNPTGDNGFPARTVTVWAIYRGNRISTDVAPGQTKSRTFPGGRGIGDVQSYGLT